MKKIKSKVLATIILAVGIIGATQIGTSSLFGQTSEVDIVTLDNEREKEIREKLNSKVEFDFDETPFEDVMEYVKDKFGIPIVVDISAEDLGLVPDQQINLRLSNLSLRSALRIILIRYECSYVIENQVLEILSAEAAEEKQNLQIYDVSELTVDSHELRDAVMNSVLPDSWEENGGTARITSINVNARNLMVISHTEDGHGKVKNLLGGILEAVLDKTPIAKQNSERTQTYLVDEKLKTKAADVVDMVTESLPEVTWSKEDGHFVKSYGSVIVVRQSPAAIHKVDQLLAGIGIGPSKQPNMIRFGGGSGGGVFQIPPTNELSK